MTMATTRTRIARLAVTGLATTGAAAAALTLVPTNAQAAEMPQVHASVVKASHTTATKAGSGNNLDGWIKQSLAIMKAKGIPGSYDGLKRNIMRESGGNPNAQNNWDINAKNGVPSKGLLQVISPPSTRTTSPVPRRTSPTRWRTSPPRPTTPPTATVRSTTSTRRTDRDFRRGPRTEGRCRQLPRCRHRPFQCPGGSGAFGRLGQVPSGAPSPVSAPTGSRSGVPRGHQSSSPGSDS